MAAEHIDYQGKTIKDLQIETIGVLNNLCEKVDKTNGNLIGHEKRILTLETAEKIRCSLKEQAVITTKRKIVIIGTVIVPLLVGIMGVVYGIGSHFGWWV